MSAASDPETAAEYMAGIAAEYDAELVAPVLRRLARYQAESGRTCERCGERKRLGDFGRDSREPSGRLRYCRECKREQNAISYAKRVSRAPGPLYK